MSDTPQASATNNSVVPPLITTDEYTTAMKEDRPLSPTKPHTERSMTPAEVSELMYSL